MSFDTLPHAGWPAIAACLSRPWPAAAAAHDLRWHAAEHHVYGRALPTERELAARWAWSKTRVHDLVSSTSWRDAARPWGWRSDHDPTTIRPAADQDERFEADNGEVSDQPPTTIRPHARDPLHPAPDQGESARARETTVEAASEPPPAAGAATAPTPQEPTAMDLHLALGTRPDLMRLLLAPTDPADERVTTLAELQAIPRDELQYRRGMGPKRAEQVATLCAEAGYPLAIAREPERPATRAARRADDAAEAAQYDPRVPWARPHPDRRKWTWAEEDDWADHGEPTEAGRKIPGPYSWPAGESRPAAAPALRLVSP